MKWVPAARNFSVRQNFLPSNETSFLRTENQSGAEQFCLARNAAVTFDLHLAHSLSRQMSDLSLCLGDVAFAIARAPSSRRTGPRYRLAQSSWLELCSDQASYEIPAERSSFFNLRQIVPTVSGFCTIRNQASFVFPTTKSRNRNSETFRHKRSCWL